MVLTLTCSSTARNATMRDPPGRPRLVRVLGVVGLFGGLLWAGIPLVAVLAFYSVEIGLDRMGILLRLGALFQFAGLSVIFMLGGVVGVNLRFRATYGSLGRLGASLSTVGFVLLLPGSVVPSGILPVSLSGIIRYIFFSGMATIALGSALLGVAMRRSGVLPSWLAVAYAASIPAGVAVGGIVTIAGAGNLALVLGMTVPFGCTWIVLGGYLSWVLK